MDNKTTLLQEIQISLWNKKISLYKKTRQSLIERQLKIRLLNTVFKAKWKSKFEGMTWAESLYNWFYLIEVYLSPEKLNLDYVQHIWVVVQYVDECLSYNKPIELPTDFLYWIPRNHCSCPECL